MASKADLVRPSPSTSAKAPIQTNDEPTDDQLPSPWGDSKPEGSLGVNPSVSTADPTKPPGTSNLPRDDLPANPMALPEDMRPTHSDSVTDTTGSDDEFWDQDEDLTRMIEGQLKEKEAGGPPAMPHPAPHPQVRRDDPLSLEFPSPEELSKPWEEWQTQDEETQEYVSSSSRGDMRPFQPIGAPSFPKPHSKAGIESSKAPPMPSGPPRFPEREYTSLESPPSFPKAYRRQGSPPAFPQAHPSQDVPPGFPQAHHGTHDIAPEFPEARGPLDTPPEFPQYPRIPVEEDSETDVPSSDAEVPGYPRIPIYDDSEPELPPPPTTPPPIPTGTFGQPTSAQPTGPNQGIGQSGFSKLPLRQPFHQNSLSSGVSDQPPLRPSVTPQPTSSHQSSVQSSPPKPMQPIVPLKPYRPGQPQPQTQSTAHSTQSSLYHGGLSKPSSSKPTSYNDSTYTPPPPSNSGLKPSVGTNTAPSTQPNWQPSPTPPSKPVSQHAPPLSQSNSGGGKPPAMTTLNVPSWQAPTPPPSKPVSQAPPLAQSNSGNKPSTTASQASWQAPTTPPSKPAPQYRPDHVQPMPPTQPIRPQAPVSLQQSQSNAPLPLERPPNKIFNNNNSNSSNTSFKPPPSTKPSKPVNNTTHAASSSSSPPASKPTRPDPEQRPSNASSGVHTRYVNMLLALDDIPNWYNLLASFFTWILLAGFLLFPGTFTSLRDVADNANAGLQKEILDTVTKIPLYVIAWVCCGIGASGMIWLWWRWSLNYIWLLSKIFVPGFLNALAGVITTLVNVYGVQDGQFSTTALSTIIVVSSTAGVCGLLLLFYEFWLLRRVKAEHQRQVGEQAAGRHGEGILKSLTKTKNSERGR